MGGKLQAGEPRAKSYAPVKTLGEAGKPPCPRPWKHAEHLTLRSVSTDAEKLRLRDTGRRALLHTLAKVVLWRRQERRARLVACMGTND